MLKTKSLLDSALVPPAQYAHTHGVGSTKIQSGMFAFGTQIF